MTTDGASITSTALHTAGLMRREHVGALMWSLESYIEQQKQHINTGVHLLSVKRQNTDTEKASGALGCLARGKSGPGGWTRGMFFEGTSSQKCGGAGNSPRAPMFGKLGSTQAIRPPENKLL